MQIKQNIHEDSLEEKQFNVGNLKHILLNYIEMDKPKKYAGGGF